MSETVNVTEAARILGVAEKTVRRWIVSGKLPSTKRGRVRLVNLRAARSLAENCGSVRYRRIVGRLYWKRPRD